MASRVKEVLCLLVSAAQPTDHSRKILGPSQKCSCTHKGHYKAPLRFFKGIHTRPSATVSEPFSVYNSRSMTFFFLISLTPFPLPAGAFGTYSRPDATLVISMHVPPFLFCYICIDKWNPTTAYIVPSVYTLRSAILFYLFRKFAQRHKLLNI